MSKQFWGVILAIVVVFGGLYAFAGSKSDSKDSSSGTASASQHIKGNPDASVTLVEYGDFQCPYCGQYYPTVEQVMEKYKDKVKFQFRNYPLTSIHQNAFAASRAAEAAAIQGKFWEMYSLLYQNQTAWSSASSPNSFFESYAKQIGLKADQFKTDSGSSKVNDIINADLAAGAKLDITGTPTFYVNGKKVQIGNSVSEFEKVLDEALAKHTPKDSGTTEQTPAKTEESTETPQ